MAPSLLADWLGDLCTVVTGVPTAGDEISYSAIKQRLVHHAAQHPIDSLVAASVGGALLFYAVERGSNPRVRTFADAFWAVSSCIAAVSDAGGASTPLGKLLLGWVMGIGPGLQALVAAEGISHRHLPPPAAALDAPMLQHLTQITPLLEEIVSSRTTDRKDG